MKAIFETNEYELVPEIYNNVCLERYMYREHTFEYQGITLKTYIPYDYKEIEDQKMFKGTQEIIVIGNLYRLNIGDKIYLKEIDKIVKIKDKVIINDEEVRFLIDHETIHRCENYDSIRSDLEKEVKAYESTVVNSAEQEAIGEYVSNLIRNKTKDIQWSSLFGKLFRKH